MKLPKFISLFTLSAATALMAQDLVVELRDMPDSTPQYIYVDTWVMLRNISTHPVNVAMGEHGLRMEFTRHRADGSLVMPPEEGIGLGQPIQGDTMKTLKPGEFQAWPVSVTKAEEPGVFSLEATVSSKGPYKFRDSSAPDAQQNVWVGEVRMTPRKIQVIAAEGEDRTALDYYRSIRTRDQSERELAVIDKYPHSMYAARFLVHLGVGCGSSKIFMLDSAATASPEERLNAMDYGGASFIVKKGSTPEERARLSSHADYRKERIADCKSHLERRIKLYRMIEEERPQFPGIERIRWNSAFALYLLSRDQEADDEVRALAKLQGKEADEARALMKARNISAEPPKPWWKIW